MSFIYAANFWIIQPLHHYRLGIGKEINSTQKKIYKNLRIINKAELVKRRRGDYFTKFEQTVSDEQNMSTLIAEIEKVAGQLSLSISNLKPEKVRHVDRLSYFSISLQFDSEFKTLIQFLHILQDQAHLFNIKQVNINTRPRKKEGRIKTKLVLSKIFIPQ